MLRSHKSSLCPGSSFVLYWLHKFEKMGDLLYWIETRSSSTRQKSLRMCYCGVIYDVWSARALSLLNNILIAMIFSFDHWFGFTTEFSPENLPTAEINFHTNPKKEWFHYELEIWVALIFIKISEQAHLSAVYSTHMHAYLLPDLDSTLSLSNHLWKSVLHLVWERMKKKYIVKEYIWIILV